MDSTDDSIIDQASVDSIRKIVMDPASQDLLAGNLSNSQIREIVDQLPDNIKSEPKVKMTLPWIRVLRLDGKRLLKWSRGSQELRSVFEEVTTNAFKSMSEQQIKTIIKGLPPETKKEMVRLLSTPTG